MAFIDDIPLISNGRGRVRPEPRTLFTDHASGTSRNHQALRERRIDASVASTEASNGRLARVGVID
jgi:hypothetical protein